MPKQSCCLALPLVLLVACSSGDEQAAPCGEGPMFKACETDSGQPGVCLLGRCESLAPCGASGCKSHRLLFPLADTNVRGCFGPSPKPGQDGRISCPGKAASATCASTDHCGQDGQYGWDTVHKAS